MELKLGYFSKDVAEQLEVTTSTLRRWSIELDPTLFQYFPREE
ncbi:hypothetical protein U5N28_08180 [Lysinibacillus telephonicus]|nr:hypothetical protein [Lysinibacillus telephonicus]